jgi:chemotaxis protein CheD
LLSRPPGYAFQESTSSMPNRINKSTHTYQDSESVFCVTITAQTNSQAEEVRVNMAEMKVESKHVELLTSVGSCVAICLHDSVNKCGGLAHVMLPISTKGSEEPLPSKFANTAVPALVNAISELNSKPTRLSAKIAGGANMFSTLGTNYLDIGAKNIKAVKTALDEYNIRLAGEDVGGLHGRKISFNVDSGRTIVRQYNGDIREL